MENYNDYRETPRTGRTPGYSDHEHDPHPVDPSVLTDDRDNPDLLTFEKTWGHRVLAGLGVAMLVIALVLVVAFLGYALAVTPQYVVTALLYALALAILPVVYLIAALKIKRSL